MKPTFQFPENRTRRGVRSPQTDYSFRPSMKDFGGRGRGEGQPSFRGISATYFNNEARSHFATEAGIFGLVVLTVAVPVVKAFAGVFVFMSSVAAL
jgi:hypothetical protein